MDKEKAMSQSESSSLPNGIGLAPWLRMKQEGMTENESRIVEWLLTPGNLSDAPAIKDVAEALSVSEAMIVKVSKLLGFSGFRNLRSALEAYFSQSEQVLPTELSFDEAPQDVVNKVFNITLRTIMEGQSIVNVDEIHRAARFFAQANQRDLYGAGGSNAICADVQHKFLRIGVRCQAYPDAQKKAMWCWWFHTPGAPAILNPRWSWLKRTGQKLFASPTAIIRRLPN